MQISFTLTFRNKQWSCYNNEIEIVADDLKSVDSQIQTFLNKKYINRQIDVAMHFDFDSFPVWMRQYMPHYFNRNLSFQTD